MAQELVDKIRAAAQARGIDPELALSIARAESSLDPRAKARTSSASGLFQVTKDTWKEYGGKPGKQMDPDENIRVGLDIIAKNTNLLKTALNRDPRPAEVYAAHYFGPTGAKSFLTADPATPIAKVLGEKAVRANPNLQGKTAGQVLAQLEGKVGGAPATAQAQMKPATEEVPAPPMRAAGEPGARIVSRETSTPAPAAGKLAALGPGYQAALALSFLADEDEKEGRDPDTGPSVAEEWLKQTASRPAALALSDISVKSPFEALGPQPQMLAEGGEVGEMQEGARKGEAYKALERYLQARGEMPSVKVSKYLPQGMDALFSSDNLNIGSGSVEISGRTPKEVRPSLLTHEMTHAADRQMKQQAIEQGMFGKSTPYTEAYEKLVGKEGRNRSEIARKMYPEWAEENEYYRSSPEELAAHGMGAFAGPTLQRRGPRHVDATAATELQILLDLAQRNVDKGPTGLSKIPAFFRKMGRYADGGEVEPTAEELAAASRPATVNPLIRRQGEAARRLAAMRDVNTLPDPRTYAAVTGFLGTAPDEQGFSALHPDIEGIKKAGEAGFYAGTATQVAPIGAAIRGLASKGTTTAAKMLEGVKNLPVGASVKPVEPFFQHIPSAEAPFVGRLDEFVAGMQAPVQKEQFLGMLKGKFRDYDIARAQAVLDDLPAKAKISPSDLLNRLKSQYDPGQFKTQVLDPKPGVYHHAIDNTLYTDRPLGVIHLSQGLPPRVEQQMLQVQETGTALSRIGSTVTIPSPQGSEEVSKRLLGILDNPAIPLPKPLADEIQAVARDYQNVANEYGQLRQARDRMFYPILQPEYTPRRDAYFQQLRQADPSLDITSAYKQADAMVVREFAEEGNRYLASKGVSPVPLPDFTTMPVPLNWIVEDSRKHLDANSLFNKAAEPLEAQRREIANRATSLRKEFGKETRALNMYEGQHTLLGGLPNPISFSRYSEHTADIPGLGKAEGIYVNELQSDLLDDLRKLGPRGGSAQKDLVEIDKLERQHDEAVKGMYTAQASGNDDLAKKYDAEARSMRKRITTLDKRVRKGEYNLSESFAGMETSPQVTQQLMAKNAIIGAIQKGKQFVAFPGKESAQAQLYEKLPNNLKQVVKDLGPGFELRPITLVDAQGRDIQHNAVVWGPEAAARLQKKGVPFKAGGLVERTTVDNRKYL